MKRKLIVGMILAIFSFSIVLNFYSVEAFSGELDPESYITLPSRISVENGIGTGTISLSSSASGYNISYQKVDITESTSNSIKSKINEFNNYKTESIKTLEEKRENMNTLLAEYETLNNSGTATTEQLEEAEARLEEAIQDLQEFSNTVSENMKTLQNQAYSLIPDYTTSWTSTTSSSNNVQLDFKNYTGTKAHFVLWVKISNGTNTYYDMNVYSTDIQQDEVVPDPNPDTDDEWTDFTNAKFELKKDGISDAIIEISNIIPNEDSKYYLFITSNNNKPNVTSNISENRIDLDYDSDKKIFQTPYGSKLSKYVELNQDLYVSILERTLTSGNEKVVIYGKKLERYAEPKYVDAFHATFISNNATQIITTFTHDEENNRKIQIKVGKITDTSILQKIKNQDSSGFASLLSFAKSGDAIYNKTVDADKDDWFAIEYNAGDGTTDNSIINLNGLQDQSYYFLYVKTDDENGKYITQEAVTLAQADVLGNAWGLHFYGSEDFEWADFGNVSTDDTTIKGPLPQTGINMVILITLGAIVVAGGAFSYIQYRKNKF